jgi:predicted nucleic acid-binding protein
MENKIVLIDTDFAWKTLTGNEQATEFMLSQDFEVYAMSSITTAELIKGCGNKAKSNRLDKFLVDFLVLHPDADISILAIELLRKHHLSHNIDINDAYIAATCLYNNLELATCNLADYKYIPDLRLLQNDVKPERKGWDSFL